MGDWCDIAGTLSEMPEGRSKSSSRPFRFRISTKSQMRLQYVIQLLADVVLAKIATYVSVATFTDFVSKSGVLKKLHYVTRKLFWIICQKH